MSYEIHSGESSEGIILEKNSMTVLKGGITNNTTVNPGGWLRVYESGTANSTTVNSGGIMFAHSGGTANSVTVNPGGYLSVSSGGTAIAVLENGGYVTAKDATLITFVPNVLSGLVISNRATVNSGTTANDTTVYSGGTFAIKGGLANRMTVSSGGSILVSSGGTANDMTVKIGGSAVISSGGTVYNATVNAGGNMYIFSGAATNSMTINSGGRLFIYSEAIVDSTTINSGGRLHLYSSGIVGTAVINSGGELIISSGCTANNITVNANGSLTVLSGGTAKNIVRTPCNGSFYIESGAIATFLIDDYSGVYYGSNYQMLSHNTAFDGTVLDELHEMNVMSGGTASRITVNSGGSMSVFRGGTAYETKVNSGGSMSVFRGGTAYETKVNFGGRLDIYSGGIAKNTDIYSFGNIFVCSGGIAKNTDISSFGKLIVSSGGLAENTSLTEIACSLCVFSGGTARNTIVSSFQRSGFLIVESGGLAESATVFNDNVFKVLGGGSATDVTLSVMANLDLTVNQNTFITGRVETPQLESSVKTDFKVENGLFSNYTLDYGDLVRIESGCSASENSINASGRLTISSGGMAARNAVNTKGTLYVSGGGIAAQNAVNAGGTIIVSSRGTAISNTVNADGKLFVSSGGTANYTIVSGDLTVSSGGSASYAEVFSGGLFSISAGGSANYAEVFSGGRITVASGGAAYNTHVSSDGRLIVESGGTAGKTIIGAGGTVRIESGGKLDSVTVQRGGRLTGYYDCGNVTFESGADLYFDISGIAPDNTGALVNISGISDTDSLPLKLLVSDSQEAGVYKLAEGAQGFDRTISVVNSVTEFGSLSLGQSVQVNGREYTLNLNDNDLMLSVSAPPPVQYVYLDFDGEDLVRYICSDLELSFDLSVSDPAFSKKQKQDIVSALSKQYEKDHIAFTLERPEDVDYSTLYFGVSSAFDDYGEFFGVSETYDGNDQDKNDNAFILLDQSYSTGQIVSVASHMLDHLMGFSYSYSFDGGPAFMKYAESKTLLSLSSGWYQSNPYNKYCPIDPRSAEQQRSMVGCTNTAASQIIYYWLEKGLLDLSLQLDAHDAFKSNYYIMIEASDKPASGHLSFAEVNELLKDFKLENEDCIAALCFAAGVVQHADYSVGTTWTHWNSNLFVRAGLDGDATYISLQPNWPKGSESYQDVNTRLADDDFMVRELLEGRPVAITLRDIDHAIVLDGYDSSRNMFHLNFGWGAWSSATHWYTIEELNELRIDETVCGIKPIVFPDLTIENLSAGEEVVNLNEDVTLSFTVSNEGKKVSTETMAYVYCGDVLLGNCSVSYVSPGYSRIFSCTISAASLPVGENVLTVKVFSQSDESGISCASVTIDHTDNPAPRTPSVSADITAPTKEDVLVSAVFSNIAAIKEYSPDGRTWSAYTEPVRVTENGTVFFRCADEAGNYSEIAGCEVTNIDKTAPVIELVGDNETPLQSSTLTATVDDGSEIFFSTDNENWTVYDGQLEITANGTYYFEATDEAGNTGTAEITFANIDSVAPTAPNGLDFIVSDRKVALLWNVSTDDLSGVREYVVNYSLNGQVFTARTSGTNYVLNNADYGEYSWSVQAVDFTGNESVISAGEAFTVSEAKPYYSVEYSADGFEHTIRFSLSSPELDVFRMPGGTYRLRVRTEGGGEWTEGDSIAAAELDDTPQLVESDADGNADVFFANPAGTWESCYFARHVGSVNDWAGTNELTSVYGKNKLADIIEGSTDANILLMTDDDNGDTLFVDDIYTASPGSIAEKQARIARIDEIRAGAGHDIVDMTSQQFEYIGDGLSIRGGEGNDTIWANKGDNFLFGDAGNDRLVGASGNDVIAGGIGNDRMHGGGGGDVFTFCGNWGVDNVEQLAAGSVTLWFAEGSRNNWDEATLTYTDGENSVRVSGVALEKVTLKFGDDGSEEFATLFGMGAFFDATTERIFEESGKGILASL